MTDTPTTATGAPGEPLLVVEHLRTSFPTDRGLLLAVDDVSFTLDQGQTLGIVGESGSGKSVLVRTIMGLNPPTAIVPEETKIHLGGRDARHLNYHDAKHFWGTEVAMIFQDPMTSLNPVKKIGTHITEPLRYHLGLSKKQATERALDLMNQVGIPEARRRLDQYPHELSGGMRQRVTIAIALSCEPRLLIADEPTTALDVTVQKQILDLLARAQRERHMAMILITHDLGVVAGYADRIAVMYAGQLVESSGTFELFDHMRHPYSEALLRSIPRVEHPSHTRLDAISGRPPNMINLHPGCRFAPRCRYVQPTCREEDPPLFTITEGGGGHVARCFFPVGTDAGRAALARNELAGAAAAAAESDSMAMS
jgi:peptide/nickel transport system ATP-binding protein